MRPENYGSEISLAETESERIQDLHDLFTRRENIDAWQHERMLRFLLPVIAAYPDAHWLTVGDSGLDAWILQKWGVKAVTASSVSDARLKILKQLGYLKDIEVRALNAENLELPDSSIDIILCRQAYHHVHRAPLAFYEFLRVSRLGFVLIEPSEFTARPLNVVRTAAKLVLRHRRPIYDSFEPAGNYIYRVSERETFRMLAGIQLPWFGVKFFNNFYNGWLAGQRRDSLLARSIFYAGVGIQDALSRCRLMSPGLCAVFVPKSASGEAVRGSLRSAGFRIVQIPKNPWLT